jgi:hypothetical protein
MARIDPSRNFRDRLEVDNIAEAGFSEVMMPQNYDVSWTIRWRRSLTTDLCTCFVPAPAYSVVSRRLSLSRSGNHSRMR